MNRWVALLLCLTACDATRLDAGHDTFDYGLALGPGRTCSYGYGEEIRCLGLGSRGQLAIPPDALSERCAGQPCSSEVREGSHVAYGPLQLGREFGCGVVPDGTLCFGDARWGQLGNGVRDDEPHPVVESVDVWHRPSVLAVGNNHACVLARDGQVYCWGDGTHGQLGRAPDALEECGLVGDDDTERFLADVGTPIRCSATPEPIPGIRGATELWTGSAATCFRSEDGVLRCVGRNINGSLGVESTQNQVTVPSRSLVQSAVQLALGPRHGCALDSQRELTCFGEAALGQLGRTAADECGVACARSPVKPQGLETALSVAVGTDVTYVIDVEHQLWSFGSDVAGRLGAGTSPREQCGATPCSTRPIPAKLDRAVVALRAGADHACAITSAHQLWCWGSGASGALGDALLEDARVPRLMKGLLVREQRGVDTRQ